MASKKEPVREELDRISPQGVYDQAETEQVGGTVVNAPLNRDEYAVDQKAIKARRKAAAE